MIQILIVASSATTANIVVNVLPNIPEVSSQILYNQGDLEIALKARTGGTSLLCYTIETGVNANTEVPIQSTDTYWFYIMLGIQY